MWRAEEVARLARLQIKTLTRQEAWLAFRRAVFRHSARGGGSGNAEPGVGLFLRGMAEVKSASGLSSGF
jgi:hypothetical protein